jgi:hypothetical protein
VVAPRELAFAGNFRFLLEGGKGSYATNLEPESTPMPTPLQHRGLQTPPPQHDSPDTSGTVVQVCGQLQPRKLSGVGMAKPAF